MTLSNQSNLGVSSFGATTSKPVLRGYSGDRFLLTKSGSKTGDLSQSANDHAIALDITEVNQIEIIRGPKSLIYGSNVIGGVINTVINGSPKVRVNKFYKKIMLGTESFNKGMYGNLALYVPIRDNQINMTINNRLTSNQTSPIGELDNTGSKVANYKLGFTRYSNNGYFNFIIENYKMDYGIPPSIEGHINGVDIELMKNTYQINYHQDISLLNINQIDIKYNFINYEHKEFENNSDYYSVSLAKNTHNLKIELQSPQTVFGSELDYKQFTPGGFYWTPVTNEYDLSLYGFHEVVLNNFNLLGSFRAGYLSIQPNLNFKSYANLEVQEIKDRSFKYFSSSIGMKKIINKFEFNTWVMNTMKAPMVEELYSDGPHLGVYSYEIGNPDLDLEKTYGIESSIKYRTSPFNISFTGFYNYSPYYYQMNKMGQCQEQFVNGQSHPCAGADFIEWGSGSSGWLYKYQSKAIESLIKGLEFNLYYVYQDFKIEYDFSLVRGNDLTNDSYLSHMNPDKQTLTLEYQADLISYKLRLSNIHSQNKLGEFENYTPSSFLFDFIIGYQRNNHSITMQINNAFDQKHYNHLSRIKSIIPEAGRNIVLLYNIAF